MTCNQYPRRCLLGTIDCSGRAEWHGERRRGSLRADNRRTNEAMTMDYELTHRFERVPSYEAALTFMADVLEAWEASEDATGAELVDRIDPLLNGAHSLYMRFNPGNLLGATPGENLAYQNRMPHREANRIRMERSEQAAFLEACTPTRQMVGRSAQSLLDEEANAADEYGR